MMEKKNNRLSEKNNIDLKEPKLGRRQKFTQTLGKISIGWFFFGLFIVILIVGIIWSWIIPGSTYIEPFLYIIDIILYPFGRSTVENGNRLRIIFRGLAAGAKLTILISAISLVIGFFIAIFLAITLVDNPSGFSISNIFRYIFKFFARAYVDFFRSTPLLVQIFMIYFGLPMIFDNLRNLSIFGIPIGIEVFSGTLGLSLNTAAYQAEILRSGILAIPSGQTEAARGLGLTKRQTMRHVILPQAIRLIVPPLTNEAINIILNSSLVSQIGVKDLTKKSQSLQSTYFMPEIFFFAAIFYFIIAYSLSKVAHSLEVKLRIPGLGVHND